MGDEYDESNKESIKIERELKDRVRVKLGMEKRLTPEILGINEYATKIGINPVGAKVAVLGLTFKEDCPDMRNTKVISIIDNLLK